MRVRLLYAMYPPIELALVSVDYVESKVEILVVSILYPYKVYP